MSYQTFLAQRAILASLAILGLACASATKGDPAGIGAAPGALEPPPSPPVPPAPSSSRPPRESGTPDAAPVSASATQPSDPGVIRGTPDMAAPSAKADGPPMGATDVGGSVVPAPPSAKAVLDCAAISKDLVRTNHVKNCDRSLPKFYCDGRVVALLAVKPNVPMLLGMGQGKINPLPGDLDVVRFYDRVLTAADVAAHAKKMYEPCKAGSGCTVELDFDAEESGGFKDTGPSAVPTKINGEVKTVPGVQGNAAHFDGKGWVEIPHHAAVTFTKTFSFSAWIRSSPGCLPGEKCEFMRIFDKSDSLRLDRHAGGTRFQNTAWWFHGPGIEDKKGVWLHLAVTFDHERGVVWYRDGRESKSCRL